MLRVHNLISLVAGASSVLAFAPFDYSYLVFFSVAVLFWTWLAATARQAAWTGYFFGLGLLGTGTFWLHVSIDQFGGVPLPVAMALAVIFSLFMSLFYAMAGWLAVILSERSKANRSQRLLIVFPAIWILAEVGRGYFLTGFPWLSLGYSQIDSPLVTVAPLMGVFGVSWLAVVIAALLVLLVLGGLKEKATGLVVAIVLAAAVVLLSYVSWSEKSGEQIKVSMVQGNIPQKVKWNPDYFNATVEIYMGLSFQQKADLVIWPETALPAFYDQVRGSVISPLQQQLESTGTEMVIGVPVKAEDHGYFNSMVSLGTVQDRYDKRHLVPFGEYAPLDFILRPLIDYFRIPMSNFRRGESERSLLQVGQYQVGVSICYEDAFGNETAQALPDAAFLVNISNDAWFGDSLAPYQHLQIARMRAAESSRYMLRSTNTGISAIIDAHGKVLKRSEQAEKTVVHGEIYPLTGMTLYAAVKDWLVVLLAVGSLALLMFVRRAQQLH